MTPKKVWAAAAALALLLGLCACGDRDDTPAEPRRLDGTYAGYLYAPRDMEGEGDEDVECTLEFRADGTCSLRSLQAPGEEALIYECVGSTVTAYSSDDMYSTAYPVSYFKFALKRDTMSIFILETGSQTAVHKDNAAAGSKGRLVADRLLVLEEEPKPRYVWEYDADWHNIAINEYDGGALSWAATYDTEHRLLSSASYNSDGTLASTRETTYDGLSSESLITNYESDGTVRYTCQARCDELGRAVFYKETSYYERLGTDFWLEAEYLSNGHERVTGYYENGRVRDVTEYTLSDTVLPPRNIDSNRNIAWYQTFDEDGIMTRDWARDSRGVLINRLTGDVIPNQG